jgi:CubicO group peptidase (beta-lactamase class C family)
VTTDRAGSDASSSERAQVSLPSARAILHAELGEAYSAAALHVRVAGETVEHVAVGNYAPGDAGIDGRAIFDLASLTKLYTTTALLALHDHRALALDDPIVHVLPEFAGKDPRRARVTVKHLLTHTSGLPAHVSFREELGLKPVIARVCATSLEAAPGEAVEYSDLGFMLAGEMVSRLANEPLEKAIATLVCVPMGLADVRYRPTQELRPRIACTENDPWRGRLLRGEVHDENCWAMGGVAGHAGLFATAADVAALGELYRTAGQSAGGRVISRASALEATREHAVGNGERRGLGWALKADDAHSSGARLSALSFGHTGFTGTSLWVDPTRDLTVAFLTNRVHLTRDGASILRARGKIHDAIADEVDAWKR